MHCSACDVGVRVTIAIDAYRGACSVLVASRLALSGWAARLQPGLFARYGEFLGEVGARVDVKLLVDVAKVVLDRLRAEKERGCGVPCRLSPGEQERDLQLLRGQFVNLMLGPRWRRVSPVAASSVRARSAQGRASRRSNVFTAA